MVAREGGYYGAAFKGAQGVTQVDPLSPTIFNVVVDAVVRHWVTVMVEGTEERGERGQEGRHQNTRFYTDNGMVASSDPHGSRVHLVTWSDCSVGWACRIMSERQSAWSAAHSRLQGPSWRRRTGNR